LVSIASLRQVAGLISLCFWNSQYLGSLKHANNALMLKELGITHVVSMGESALTPPRPPTFSIASSFGSNAKASDNSLWLEERLGNIAVLDMRDVADDGIDSIRPHMDEALAFIEEARWQGGKVLVHCRVGVSRSASIVIAYLMKHIELDLASAYLLTRSRRLNILIQVSNNVRGRRAVAPSHADRVSSLSAQPAVHGLSSCL
jgi:dual specificity MAP kinase phosphatase